MKDIRPNPVHDEKVIHIRYKYMESRHFRVSWGDFPIKRRYVIHDVR